MSGTEIGSFDDIVEVEWVKFDQGPVTVRFVSSEFLLERNAYDKRSYQFAVEDSEGEKLMGVTSKRLMLKLKEYHPLEGKTLKIERVGRDMETDYKVSEVTE